MLEVWSGFQAAATDQDGQTRMVGPFGILALPDAAGTSLEVRRQEVVFRIEEAGPNRIDIEFGGKLNVDEMRRRISSTA